MPTEQTFGSSPSAKRCHGTCAHPPRSASCACCARAPGVHLSPASRHLLLHVGAGLRGLFPAGISSASEQKSCGRRSVCSGAASARGCCVEALSLRSRPDNAAPSSLLRIHVPGAELQGEPRGEEAGPLGAWQLQGGSGSVPGAGRVECEVRAPPAAQAGSTLNVGLTDVPSDRAESHVTAWLGPT